MEKFHCAQEARLILKNCIEPKLKSEGFKKNGNNFYRLNPEFIAVCKLKFGRSNSKDYAWFSYRIRISIPWFYEKFDLYHANKFECTIIDLGLGSIMSIVNNTPMEGYEYKLGYPGYDIEALYNSVVTNSETLDAKEKMIDRVKYLNLLEKRYNHMNLEDARNTVAMDLDDIVIPFFNKIKSIDDLVELIITKNLEGEKQNLFLLNYFVEKGELDKGLQFVKDIYQNQNDFYKVRIDKYLNDKGLSMQ